MLIYYLAVGDLATYGMAHLDQQQLSIQEGKENINDVTIQLAKTKVYSCIDKDCISTLDQRVSGLRKNIISVPYTCAFISEYSSTWSSML